MNAGVNKTEAVLREVQHKREYQDNRWGGPDHDDEHSTADFVQWIQDYAAWARVKAGADRYQDARERLLDVAALAVAAVESIDRRGMVR